MADIFGHDKGFNIQQVPTYSQYTTLNTKVSALDTKVTQILGNGFGTRTVYNSMTPKQEASQASVVNGGLDIKQVLNPSLSNWEVYNALSATVDASYTSLDISGWAYINKNGFWLQDPSGEDATNAHYSWGIDLLNLGDLAHLNMPIVYKKADSQGRINWNSPNRAQRWRFNVNNMFASSIATPDSDHSNWKFIGDIEYSNPKYNLMKPFAAKTHPYDPQYTATVTLHPADGSSDNLSDWGEVRCSHDGFTRYLPTGDTTIHLGDTLRVICGNPSNPKRVVVQNRWILGNTDIQDFIIDGDMHVDVYPYSAVTIENGIIYAYGAPLNPIYNGNPGYSWKGAFVAHNSSSVDSQTSSEPVMSWWLTPGLLNRWPNEFTEAGVGAVGPGTGVKCIPIHQLPPETTIKYHVTLNILHPGGD